MPTLCGLGVSQHSWLSLILTMPRFCWAEEVRDYGFSCGAATPACRFPWPASKLTARQDFRERFPCRNHLKAWRDPLLRAVPWVLQAQGCRADLTPIPCWKIRLPQVLLEKLTTQCLIPARRRHLGAFF